LEVAAGCDVNEWQRKYPSLAFMGGIDKRVLGKWKRSHRPRVGAYPPGNRTRALHPATWTTWCREDVSWDNYRYYANG